MFPTAANNSMSNFTEFFFGNQARRKTILWIAILMVSGLILLMVFDFVFYSTNKFNRLWNWVDIEKYQAVFLSNGQVYFGKVADVNDQTIILEDIYYLKTSAGLQKSGDDSSAKNEQKDEGVDKENFSLVKLGNEIHGPEDKMSLNLQHVLFIENLKSDSKVTEAIREYKLNKK